MTTLFLKNADVLVIPKFDEAAEAELDLIRSHIARHNPSAAVIEGNLAIQLDAASMIRGGW